ELAYPGILSMPFVAWKCGDQTWRAVRVLDPATHAAVLQLRTVGNDLDVRLECFGQCAFDEVRAQGSWEAIAGEVARTWNVHARWPALASRYERYHFFVRSWVADSGEPLRTDWSADALALRMKTEPPKTISFAFGIDPNEVDLGRYFWSEGAEAEMRALIAA